MKDKLEKNMYVRTKEWGIQKIAWFDNEEPIMECGFTVFQKSGYKASHNIIDLIEVGDYVNGSKVIEIEKDYKFIDNEIRDILWLDNKRNNAVWKETIKSIVTKEMFSSMEYRLGDDK